MNAPARPDRGRSPVRRITGWTPAQAARVVFFLVVEIAALLRKAPGDAFLRALVLAVPAARTGAGAGPGRPAGGAGRVRDPADRAPDVRLVVALSWFRVDFSAPGSLGLRYR